MGIHIEYLLAHVADFGYLDPRGTQVVGTRATDKTIRSAGYYLIDTLPVICCNILHISHILQTPLYLERGRTGIQ